MSIFFPKIIKTYLQHLPKNPSKKYPGTDGPGARTISIVRPRSLRYSEQVKEHILHVYVTPWTGQEKIILINPFLDILTCLGGSRPGNKTNWVVFDVESECLGPRTYFLSLDHVLFLRKHVPYMKIYLLMCVCFLLFLLYVHGVKSLLLTYKALWRPLLPAYI